MTNRLLSTADASAHESAHYRQNQRPFHTKRHRAEFFAPAVSRTALKVMRQTVRSWHLQLKCDKSLAELSVMFNPTLRGWHQYYGRFYESAMSAVWKHLNEYLTRWLMRKYQRLARHKARARKALGRPVGRSNSPTFGHFKIPHPEGRVTEQ